MPTPDHWDVIEGQGSLFHPVLCRGLAGAAPRQPAGRHRRLPRRRARAACSAIPTIPLPTHRGGDRAEPARSGRGPIRRIRCGGVTINTSSLDGRGRGACSTGKPSGSALPVADPIRGGDALRAPARLAASADAADRSLEPSCFQRFLLPGLAFKAVVIGGGYATGRELAEFFLPSGPRGGLAAMLVAMLLFSLVCIATFLFARATGDARLSELLPARCSGRAGSRSRPSTSCSCPDPRRLRRGGGSDRRRPCSACRPLVGTLALMAGIILFVDLRQPVGRAPVRLCLLPALRRLCPVRAARLHAVRRPDLGRLRARRAGAAAGLRRRRRPMPATISIGAVVILPVVAPPDQPPRRDHRRRDRRAAGDAAGPALLHRMVAFYPEIAGATLPSDYPAPADGLAGLPSALPADDLLRLARKRRERGPRDQRADRQGLAAAARRGARPTRRASPSPSCCWSAACCSPAASASSP